MKITAISALDLSPQQVAAWSQLQREEPSLDSPYFRPEFTQAVAAVHKGVEVAVLEEGGETVGFFPYQRDKARVGRPVGAPLSDFQGVVVRSDVQWDAAQLIQDCRLSAWHFDHLLACQEPFARYQWLAGESPFMDLSHGFEAYSAERRRAHSDELTHALRKGRKIQREVAPLRFDVHCPDPQILKTLIAWKTEQYGRTNALNCFAMGWPVRLLERILQLDGDSLSAVLSTLYVGERLIAIHLGMRSRHVLHSWFPAFDREFYRYSPGLLLLAEIAKASPDLGIQRIDLGKGPEPYKRSFQSGTIALAEGSIDFRPIARTLRRNWQRARDWARPTRLGALAQRMVRKVRVWTEPRS